MLTVLVTALTSADLLRAQAAALERFLVGDYRLVVVNDARDFPDYSNLWTSDTHAAITETCHEVDAAELRFPQGLHRNRYRLFPATTFWKHETANTRCADAVQWGVDHVRRTFPTDPLLILDADLIPFRHFNPASYLDALPAWGVGQSRAGETRLVHYLWNGLVLVDPARLDMTLFNFDCGKRDGARLDVGGMLCDWLEANDGKVGGFTHIPSGHWHVNGAPQLPEPLREFLHWESEGLGQQHAELYADCFIHLRGGGNWEMNEADVARERIARFVGAIEALLAEEVAA